MQLNITTDYAIRIILFLVMKKEIVASSQLSMQMQIPQTYVSKITRKLAKAGLIKTHLGKDGGFCLIKEPEQITLLDIINIMENTIKCNRCLEEDRYCSRNAADKCAVHDFYMKFQEELENRLASIHIQQLIEKNEKNKLEKVGGKS